MSLTVTTDVFCDATDDDGPCEGWIFGTTSNKTEAKVARSNAAKAGWTRRRVDGRWLDLCPEHSAPSVTPRPSVVAPSGLRPGGERVSAPYPHPEYVPEWDVLRDEDGQPVTLTVKQSQAVWHALAVVDSVRRTEGYRSLWDHPQVDIGKSRLLGRMLFDGKPPTRTKPPIVFGGPHWPGLPGGDPFDPVSDFDPDNAT